MKKLDGNESEVLMTNNENINEVITSDVESDVQDLYIKFGKPFNFEEESYEGVDLSGLENLTSKDLTEIEKKFFRVGVTSFTPENTSTYARIVAQKASGLPIEFFEQLPVKEAIKIKNVVTGFFYN